MAGQSPETGFRFPAYSIDIDWLHEAFRRTRKDGAVGVDGQTADQYAADLERNLQSLLDRAKFGRYRAWCVRWVENPKDNGKTRPIGIPTFEPIFSHLPRAPTAFTACRTQRSPLHCVCSTFW